MASIQSDEVTAEYLAKAAEKYWSAYEKICRLAVARFEAQLKAMVEMQQELLNVSVEEGISGSFPTERLVEFFQLMFEGVKGTFASAKKSANIRIGHLQYLCKEDIGKTDYRGNFLSRADSFEAGVVEIGREMMPILITSALSYRLSEKTKITKRDADQAWELAKYYGERAEKCDDFGSHQIPETTKQMLDENFEKFEFGRTSYENDLQASTEVFQSFLDERCAILGRSIETYQTSCKELIDLCERMSVHNSSEFIHQLWSVESHSIKSFENYASGFLERICATLTSSSAFVDEQDFYLHNLRFPFQFKQEMQTILKEKIQSLQSQLKSIRSELDNYRLSDRARDDSKRIIHLFLSEQARVRSNAKFEKIPEIDLSSYPKIALGRGGEGTVYKSDLPGNLINSDEEIVSVACKKFENGTMESDSSLVHSMLPFSRFRHDNLVRFLGRGFMDDHHFLLMELCPRSLHNVLSTCRMENKFLESDDFIQWSEGLTSGLIFLGEMGFSHGDIKPENLLIGTDNQLKITDFGLSSRMDLANHYSITEKKGTVRYMGPEKHNGFEMNIVAMFASDRWSYGIVLWEMISCKIPFGDLPETALTLHIGRDIEKCRPPLLECCSCETLTIMLRKCWNPIVYYRSSFEDSQLAFEDLKKEIEDGIKHDPDFWIKECEAWAKAKHQ